MEMETDSVTGPETQGEDREARGGKGKLGETEGRVPCGAHAGELWAPMTEEGTRGLAGHRSQPHTCPQAGAPISRWQRSTALLSGRHHSTSRPRAPVCPLTAPPPVVGWLPAGNGHRAKGLAMTRP